MGEWRVVLSRRDNLRELWQVRVEVSKDLLGQAAAGRLVEVLDQLFELVDGRLSL